MKKKAKRLFILLFITLAVAFATALALPWWTNRFSFLVQYKINDWTGITLHRLPSNFSGTLRFWDEYGNLTQEEDLKNGKPDGIWVRYGSDGKNATGEYRNGRPWDGICYMIYMKSWIAEYRQGKPWNGCFPLPDSKTDEDIDHYFINGTETSETDYRNHFHIPKDATCMGLNYIPNTNH